MSGTLDTINTIVEYLADSPDVRNAAHTLKAFARPFLDNRQFDKVSKELDRLTSNFSSVLEEVTGRKAEDSDDEKQPQTSFLHLICTFSP